MTGNGKPEERCADKTMKIRHFDELTNREVYEILKARMDVFMIGQNIHVLDMDDEDYTALHLFETDESGCVTAYLRLYEEENAPDTLHFGRVLAVPQRCGRGRHLMEEAERFARQKGKTRMVCSAQLRSAGFYEKCGYHRCSEEYEEAGIPHVRMEKEL